MLTHSMIIVPKMPSLFVNDFPDHPHTHHDIKMAQTTHVWILYIINTLEGINDTCFHLKSIEAQTVRTLLAASRHIMTAKCADLDEKTAFRLSSDCVTRIVTMVLCSMRLVDQVHGDQNKCFAKIESGLSEEFCMMAFTKTFDDIFDNHAWLANALAVTEILAGHSRMCVADNHGHNMPVRLLAVPKAARDYVRSVVMMLPSGGRESMKDTSPEIKYLVEHGSECRLKPGNCVRMVGVEPCAMDYKIIFDSFAKTEQRAITLYYMVVGEFGGRQVTSSKLMPSRHDGPNFIPGPIRIRTETPIHRSSPMGFVPVDGDESATTDWDDASSVVALSKSLETIGKAGGLQINISSPLLFGHLLSAACDSMAKANKQYGVVGVMCLVFRLLVYASLHTSVMAMVESTTEVSPRPLEDWGFDRIANADPNWSCKLCAGVSSNVEASLTPAANYLSAALCQLLSAGTRWWTTCDSLHILSIDQGNSRVPLVWLVPRKIKHAFAGVDKYCGRDLAGSLTLLEDVFANQDAAREAEDDLLREITMEGAEAPIKSTLGAIKQAASEVLIAADSQMLRGVILTTWGTVCVPLAEAALCVMYNWTPGDDVESLITHLRTNPTSSLVKDPIVLRINP